MAVRITEQNWVPTSDGVLLHIKGFCLAADTKPTGNICTGSSLFAVDSGKTYYYDESSSTWADPTADS